MPVRPRRQRRRRVPWSPAVALALTIGPSPVGPQLGDELLAAAWSVYGPLVLDGYPPGRRPWAWWKFEASVRDDLRGERPALYPVEDADRVLTERADLELRRAAWLAERGARSAHSNGARSASS